MVDYYRPEDGWIETQRGRFSLANPTFDIADIAHALSMNCRYNGHCKRFYSVAEHSVMVSFIMAERGLGAPFEGLMHDATEAYLSDVPAPFKQFLPDWKKIDLNIDAKLREHFNVGPKTEGCKEADWLALYIEAFDLLPSRGAAFSDPANLRDKALLIKDEYPVYCWSSQSAEWAFLQRYKQLRDAAL